MITFSDSLKKTKGLVFPVGEKRDGELLCSDLSDISHLLVAGATGTGKSVFLHSLLLSLIYHNKPSALRLILCDSKLVEFGIYNGIGHLLTPIVTASKTINSILQWAVFEISKRLKAFSENGKRSLQGFNDIAWEHFSEEMPQILIVIDDFSSVISDCPDAAENMMQIITQGRTAGVHLIAVSQTPTWKAAKPISIRFRAKLLFSAATSAESRLLIGKHGAELLGSFGEALFSCGGTAPINVHTIMPSETEISSVLSSVAAAQYDISLLHYIEHSMDGKGSQGLVPTDTPEDSWDELLPVAIDVVLETGQASVSMLQRRLKLGYGRAARLVDQMEEKGIVGPFEGSTPRTLLITKEQWKKLR